MPARPDLGLHANRPFSVPTAGGVKDCFSRTDILDGSTPAAWASTQSTTVGSEGESKDNPDTWPKGWYNQGRVLRVPKAVVLSSHPQWTLYWPGCYFIMPRDVIFDDGFGGLGNYYYLEQWNTLDPNDKGTPDYSWVNPNYDMSLRSSPDDSGATPWTPFRFVTDGDKATVYNAKESCYATSSGDSGRCEDIPETLLNLCPTPSPDERFQQIIGRIDPNPYYDAHARLVAAFLGAKEILENDPVDPILVSIPDWQPPVLAQVRNSLLKMSHEKLDPDHGGAVNYQPCAVNDSEPCVTHVPICWAPPYPDVNSPLNTTGFAGPTVPWLMNTDPGFGTNTLHIYIGHPNVAYTEASSIFDYQAWPLTPEVAWIAGPVYAGNYLGATLPFFSGRRVTWGGSGLDYGYSIPGGYRAVYDHYAGLITAAAAAYKENSWKFRNFGTRTFTYAPDWSFGWSFSQLFKDRRNYCPATQFYTGHDFADFANSYNTIDNNITDCAGFTEARIKFGETANFFPAYADITRAEFIGSQISLRVEAYYRTLDPTASLYYQHAIDQNGLADYNVVNEGPIPTSFYSAEGIVEYVRKYFAENP